MWKKLEEMYTNKENIGGKKSNTIISRKEKPIFFKASYIN